MIFAGVEIERIASLQVDSGDEHCRLILRAGNSSRSRATAAI